MRSDDAPLETWAAGLRSAITRDPVWRLPAYRLALYASDLAWDDCARLVRHPITADVSRQLYRALGSVGANLAEGYSRSSGRDRVRFYEYALGSARECAVWYRSGRPVLGDDVVDGRTAVVQRVVRILLDAIPRERSRVISNIH